MSEEISDLHTASDDYARRFSGRAGAWMLAVQEKLLLSLMRDHPGAAVLDVGGGHGQTALPLARTGFKVTVLGSSEDALRQVAAAAGTLIAKHGPLLAIPESDKSFEVVISFRLLPHCDEWPRLIAELCRTARDAVIVDYPTSRSVNAIAPLLFGVKKNLEGNTRPFRLFSHAEVDAEFSKHGFRLRRRLPEFFFPMVLHRMLKQPAISSSLEWAPAMSGLSSAFGSPVIAEYRRKV
jgi:2-polyprenyl-3-methyl-5-hydroxy-6-metoxy-1,4-benzoquinol methylase